MYSVSTKIALFLFICMVIRFIIIMSAVYAEKYKGKFKYILVLVTLFIGLGFLYSTFYGKDVGAFGSPVYWNRKVHSFFYITFAIALMFDIKYAFLILVLDQIFGLYTFYNHYY